MDIRDFTAAGLKGAVRKPTAWVLASFIASGLKGWWAAIAWISECVRRKVATG